MKSDKFFNATYSCFIGVSITILGLVILIGRKWLYINVINLLMLAIFISSLKHFLNFFIGRNNYKKVNFTRSILEMIFCFILIFFKNIPLSILPLIVGFYFLLNALIKYVNAIIFFNNRVYGELTEFIVGTFYFLLAIQIIHAPITNINNVLLILGVYLLLLGISYIFDFVFLIIPIDTKNRFRNKFRINLPKIVEAVIPYTVLSEINYLINKESYDKPFVFEEKQNSDDPDMEIFVHITNHGFNKMGHVDICIGDKVISYGGYDDESQYMLNSIGDGVLYTTKRSKYINFCIEHSKKTIFAYGLKLTDKQKENLNKTLDKLFDKELYKWEPPYQRDLLTNKDINIDDYEDYASNLYYKTKASFYKFYRGKYKKFFLLGNNCGSLVSYIINKSRIDVLRITGIITPGTYYEYLNREFQRKNSLVISRRIYNDKNKMVGKVYQYKGFSK